MRASVLAAFPGVTDSLEGTCFWLYADKLGKITTGQGYLIDSIAAAQAIPWQRPDGTLAMPDEVAQAWIKVKGRKDLYPVGGGQKVVQDLTTIRISQATMEGLIRSRLLTNEVVLRGRIGAAAYDSAPADAQLGLHSLAWACGSGMHFPTFLADYQAATWATYVMQAGPDGTTTKVLSGGCAKEVFMSPAANPGNDLRRRNALNQALFEAAERAAVEGLDFDVLHYLDPAAQATPDSA